jgi:phospholipid/cholesterol/gamma-HCH transport system substrate-binding protein
VQIFQGEGGTLQSLLSKTSSFSTALADNNQTVQQLIDNLNTVVGTVAKDGDKFSGAIDRLERLISGLAEDRDPIGTAIDSLDAGTASIAGLLTQARPPLAGVVEQLSRAAPVLDNDKDLMEAQIKRLPENYRKLVRIGAYGSFINYYICGITVRVSDQQGKTAQFPWWSQDDQGNGRCREP